MNSKLGLKAFGILVIILFSANLVQCGISTYENEPVDGTLYTERVAMFSPDDAPSKSSPGDGKSFVKFDLKFSRTVPEKDIKNATLSVLLFNFEERDAVGVLESDQKRHICCSPDLLAAKKCTREGGVVLTKDPSPTLILIDLNFLPESSEVTFQQTINIEKSGIYYLYFVNCQGSGVEGATFSGTIEFMNPFGFLPGELWYYLPFYGTMALLYIVVGIGWLVLTIKYWTQILRLQNYIGGVIVLGIIEMATLYFDDLGYNISDVAAMMVGVIVSTIKKSISRILVLVVSMGYGVVKPTLGAERNRVILLGILYVAFSGTLNIIELVQRTPVFSTTVVFFVVFPVAVLDTVFYWWVSNNGEWRIIQITGDFCWEKAKLFPNKNLLIQQLTTRKQPIKLEMYKRFFGTLIVSGILSSIIIVIQLFIGVMSDADEMWRSIWVWTAFWHLLYFAILVSIVILWRPTQNNTRYAYQEVTDDVGEEVVLQPLSGLGETTQRKKEDKKDEPSEPAKVDQVSLDTESTVFQLDEEEKGPQAKMD